MNAVTIHSARSVQPMPGGAEVKFHIATPLPPRAQELHQLSSDLAAIGKELQTPANAVLGDLQKNLATFTEKLSRLQEMPLAKEEFDAFMKLAAQWSEVDNALTDLVKAQKAAQAPAAVVTPQVPTAAAAEASGKPAVAAQSTTRKDPAPAQAAPVKAEAPIHDAAAFRKWESAKLTEIAKLRAGGLRAPSGPLDEARRELHIAQQRFANANPQAKPQGR